MVESHASYPDCRIVLDALELFIFANTEYAFGDRAAL